MARAKRTDRAEARRKYRAYLQAQEEAEASAAAGYDDSDDVAEAPSPKTARAERRPQPAVQPGARMGLVAAAKAASRTPHYIDDIRNVRSLVFGSNAIWPVLAVCIISGIYAETRIASNNYAGDPILPFLFQFLFYPVPLLPPMMAGFLAPRSTWLAGLIASFIATTTLVLVLAASAVTLSDASNSISGTSPSPIAQASPSESQPAASASIAASPEASAPAPSPTPEATAAPDGSSSSGNTTGDLLGLMVQLLLTSLVFGALMGALSGWYKRFLAATSVPRNRPPSRSSGNRSQQRRPATKR